MTRLFFFLLLVGVLQPSLLWCMDFEKAGFALFNNSRVLIEPLTLDKEARFQSLAPPLPQPAQPQPPVEQYILSGPILDLTHSPPAIQSPLIRKRSPERASSPEPKKKKKKTVTFKLPSPTRTYYLVRFDQRLARLLTFCGTSPHAVLSNYVRYLFSDPTTSEYQGVYSRLQEKFPHALVKQDQGEYYLDCIEARCGYSERQASVQEVAKYMVLHSILMHRRDGEFYQSALGRVRESFNEAFEALKGKK